MTYREAQKRKKKRIQKLKELKQFYEEFLTAFLELIYEEDYSTSEYKPYKHTK